VRERERERWGEGVPKQNFAVLEVLRQCPLVLLVEVRVVLGINSISVLKKLERLQWGEI
jgi:hypothetical protein